MDEQPPPDLVRINTRDAPADDDGVIMTGMPHGKAISMRLHWSRDGASRLSIPYDPRLVGDPASGILHGGVVTVLLDTACGSAVMSVREKIKSTATLDLRIDYMRPATPGKTVYAEAECFRMTRTVAFARALAFHEDRGTPIASATGTFVVERPKDRTP